MTEAVAQLRKGLDVLAGLPDGPWRQQQELDLQIALGSALAATKGWAAAEVGETLARARALAEQLDRPEYLVPLIVGQWAFHCVRAEHRLALPLGEQLEKIGEARNDAAAQLLGRYSARGRPASFSGSSLPPAPSWSGVWALLIRRIAPSGDCPSIPTLRCSRTSP